MNLDGSFKKWISSLEPVRLGHELGSNFQKTFEFYNAHLFLKRDLTHSTAKLYAYTYFGT